MAGQVDWSGDRWVKALQGQLRQRTSAASIRFSNRVKGEISQAGTLRYQVGKRTTRQRTIYNFTHSAPGNPPYKQTGHLRRSIAWELVQLFGTTIGRVGTNLKYGRYLELGTRRMAARPFLRASLRKYGGEIAAILTAKIRPGALGPITPAGFRSGVLGRGAKGF